MKSQLSLLAVCLCGVGIANAQSTTNTYSSTTNSTYSTSPATTSDVNNSLNATAPASTSYSSGSTTNDGTANSTGITTTNTYNSAAPTYGTTTTTSSYNATGANAGARQDDDKPWGKEGKFGIYAGVNFSRFVNEPIPDGAYRAGWQAGFYGRTGGTIFGQLGLEYRNSTSNLVRSGAGQSTPTVGEVRGQINQHFVAIPAYVGIRVGSALGLRLQVGAELSTLVVNDENKFGIGKDDVTRTLLNGLAGAGINLGPLTLDAVYNLGLQNVFDNQDTKRRLLALNLGFRF